MRPQSRVGKNWRNSQARVTFRRKLAALRVSQQRRLGRRAVRG
jgi:hypothetical protein